ncbi:LacI family DNA-binding transcriptional regulator [Microbacterium sp. 22242]|uniref:LacI family DNA-binding transcriptional regulator n=1 Tax=Microbacterium sp. 22242 TaxID=3453896 RepID=UPI003F852666
MQQVADRAGVSISTVSFVVNGTKPVTPETRERIQEAIDELGYRRNAVARALASQRSRVIALLFPLLEHQLNPFVEAAATAARAKGYNLVLWPIRNDNAAAEVTSLIKTGIADGALLMEVTLEDERVTRLREAAAPFVLIGRTRDTEGIDYVDIDFESTTARALADLVALGHREVSLVVEDNDGTPLSGYAPPPRVEQAFADAALASGVHGFSVRLPRGPASGERLAEILIAEAPRTTAVISMHRDANFGLTNVLRRRGVVVPRDLSIVMLSAPESAGAVLDPAIATYAQPAEELGRLATEALIARLEGSQAPPTQVLVPCAAPSTHASVAPAPSGRPGLDAFPA